MRTIPDMLDWLKARYNVVELNFVRVDSTGEAWWGVTCKMSSELKKVSVSIGGYPTPMAVLTDAVKMTVQLYGSKSKIRERGQVTPGLSKAAALESRSKAKKQDGVPGGRIVGLRGF